jgi:histidinol-phosphate aminotransferase
MKLKVINYSKKKINNIYRILPESNTRLKSIRLDKNERANNHRNFLIKKLKREITSNLISAYPEFYKVYKMLADQYKISIKNIILTAGSDLAIKNTFELFYKKNKKVITINPTFAMVDIYCKIFKTKQVKISYNKNLELNINYLYKSIDKNTCLIILANPNSPTGTLLENDVIDVILKKARKFNIKVLVDEAYYEFSNYTCVNKIKKNNNLIIARTFSKMFGIAGLRCGLVISNPRIIKEYFSIKPMYEVNSVAVKTIELILRNIRILKHYLKEMRDGEKYAKNFCKKNNFQFIKCYTNFFHINFNYSANIIQKYLYKKNILVKGGPGVESYENYLRISFANKKVITLVLKTIKKFLDTKK